MRKGHDIIGTRAISLDTGADLGRVLDLVFDTDADRCVGLVMRERRLMHEAEVIPWEEVTTIGPDSVMVRSEGSLVGVSDASNGAVRAAMENEFYLSGHRIVTTDGRELGTFGDVFLDEQSGRVLGYEVSGGFVSDTMSGKRFLPAATGPDIGKDVVIVPPQAATHLEAQAEKDPGGLKGVVASAKEKVADAKDKVAGAYAGLAEASIEKQKGFVVGKTAGRDVFLPAASTSTENSAADGRFFVEEDTTGGFSVRPRGAVAENTPETEAAQGPILVRSGESITREHADRAEQAGILHQLLLAAGAATVTESYEDARERLAASTAPVADAAQNLAQSAEDKAIGQEAGKEVRLPSGSILAAPGMVITRAMMDEAKAAGKDKELIAAAGLGAAASGAQDAAATAQQKAGGLFDSVKEKFQELTGTVQEKKEDLDEAVEKKRINAALGRACNRIILASDDLVILNTGDIITHRAIDTAREQGVLDVLLDSVADVDPQITPEMLRAQGKGSAALPSQVEPQQQQPQTATVAPENLS